MTGKLILDSAEIWPGEMLVLSGLVSVRYSRPETWLLSRTSAGWILKTKQHKDIFSRSRDLFYTTFGQDLYSRCINIFSLMQYTTDWSIAATYVRMWSHLDFMCNIGYERKFFGNLISIKSWISRIHYSWSLELHHRQCNYYCLWWQLSEHRQLHQPLPVS